MKSFDSRTYSVNDYREWHSSNQLVLSPRFQRRSVWSENAKSYLMDTIVRGKPIPKVFIRQMIDPSSGRSIREVVDGQQRLRTILAFVSDGFVIRKTHNSEHGGKYFSQLPDEIRVQILSYEISTDLLINVSDEEVLDIFARLNSHAVVLNQQEKLNAAHFGPYKRLADDLAHSYFKYWTENAIITDAKVMRMEDVALTADLLIAMCDGIQSKKAIASYYRRYEEDFPFDVETLKQQFDTTMVYMTQIFPEGFRESEFRRVHLHYTLFTAVFHLAYGLPEGDGESAGKIATVSPQKIRARWDHVESIFDAADPADLPAADRQFLTDSRRATTDTAVRTRRTRYLVDLALAE